MSKPGRVTGRNKLYAGALTVLFVAMLASSLVIPAFAKPHEEGEEHGPEWGYGRHESHDSEPRGKAKGHDRFFAKGWALNITADGTAYNITNTSIMNLAGVTFNATVRKSSMGRAKLNVTIGNLTIGDTVHQIQWGKGLINVRSSKMVLHLNVSSTDGATRHVVLNGRLTEKLTASLEPSIPIGLNFTKPQSKLTREWLLEFKGTLTRVA